MPKSFSIILPTYTGASTIHRTLDSILEQDHSGLKVELVVVIDGPNRAIRQKIDEYKPKIENNNIGFRVIQLNQNMGRFSARIHGAKLAKYRQLLFLEDRVYLAKHYFQDLSKFRDELMLSNVIEDDPTPNLISATLSHIRNLVYGSKWRADFKDYYIDQTNFENAPKGMASLWVGQKAFIEACGEFAATQGGTKNSSDDTGVLRILIERKERLLRTSRLKVFYIPRGGFKESLNHLYERGPKFVDYYIQPGTRFFGVLIFFYLLLLVGLSGLLLFTHWVIYFLLLGLAANFLINMFLARNFWKGIRLAGGLCVVGAVFSAGLITGLIIKISRSISTSPPESLV